MAVNEEEHGAVPELPQPCDEWHELVTAADSAGRWAARELARTCSSWHLGRRGTVDIRVEPADSPVASWLHRSGRAVGSEAGGVLVSVIVTPHDLQPAEDTVAKARSLLVAHAYAAAYCTVLEEEAGVTTQIDVNPAAGTHRTGHTRIGQQSASEVPAWAPSPTPAAPEPRAAEVPAGAATFSEAEREVEQAVPDETHFPQK